MGVLVLMCTTAFAQSGTDETEEVPWPQFYYQIFLNDTIQQIENVIYREDSTQLQFKLSPDGTAIYLLDYDGKRPITATIINGQGIREEITKPHCHIHGLEHL